MPAWMMNQSRFVVIPTRISGCKLSQITAGTLVPAVLIATSHSYGNGQNLTPQQNPNPSTDYDKTLHNWLRPWGKLVTQNWYKLAVKERLARYVKYKASLFYSFYFFHALAYWSDPSADFDAQWLKLRGMTQGCAFLGSTRRPTTFMGSNSPKTL